MEIDFQLVRSELFRSVSSNELKEIQSIKIVLLEHLNFSYLYQTVIVF